MKSSKIRGFTLVELLVVIAIIGILIGMLLPAIQQVRESARRTSCLNNMKQIGLATHMFADSHKAFPPSRLLIASTSSGVTIYAPESWLVKILPYMEQQNLYDTWDFSVLYSAQTEMAVSTPVSTFLCSSRHSLDNARAPETVISGSGGG